MCAHIQIPAGKVADTIAHTDEQTRRKHIENSTNFNESFPKIKTERARRSVWRLLPGISRTTSQEKVHRPITLIINKSVAVLTVCVYVCSGWSDEHIQKQLYNNNELFLCVLLVREHNLKVIILMGLKTSHNNERCCCIGFLFFAFLPFLSRSQSVYVCVCVGWAQCWWWCRWPWQGSSMYAKIRIWYNSATVNEWKLSTTATTRHLHTPSLSLFHSHSHKHRHNSKVFQS